MPAHDGQNPDDAAAAAAEQEKASPAPLNYWREAPIIYRPLTHTKGIVTVLFLLGAAFLFLLLLALGS